MPSECTAERHGVTWRIYRAGCRCPEALSAHSVRLLAVRQKAWAKAERRVLLARDTLPQGIGESLDELEDWARSPRGTLHAKDLCQTIIELIVWQGYFSDFGYPDWARIGERIGMSREGAARAFERGKKTGLVPECYSQPWGWRPQPTPRIPVQAPRNSLVSGQEWAVIELGAWDGEWGMNR